MPFPPDQYLCDISNTLIAEERSYDIHAMTLEHNNLHSNLNENQMVIYNANLFIIRKDKFFWCMAVGGVVKPTFGEQLLQD